MNTPDTRNPAAQAPDRSPQARTAKPGQPTPDTRSATADQPSGIDMGAESAAGEEDPGSAVEEQAPQK